jgi:hypothetical protein
LRAVVPPATATLNPPALRRLGALDSTHLRRSGGSCSWPGRPPGRLRKPAPCLVNTHPAENSGLVFRTEGLYELAGVDVRNKSDAGVPAPDKMKLYDRRTSALQAPKTHAGPSRHSRPRQSKTRHRPVGTALPTPTSLVHISLTLACPQSTRAQAKTADSHHVVARATHLSHELDACNPDHIPTHIDAIAQPDTSPTLMATRAIDMDSWATARLRARCCARCCACCWLAAGLLR